MSRYAWVLGLVILVSSPAVLWAGAGLSYSNTTGSKAFNSNTVDGTLNWNNGMYLGASYNTYRSDNSSGTINTYYLRLGHYGANSYWRLYGSYTPEVSQFEETNAGFDFQTAILGRAETEQELPLPVNASGQPTFNVPPTSHANPRLDFIGGYERDMYKDQGQKINENDLTGGLGFNIYKTVLTGTFTKSVYDKEFSGVFNPNQPRFTVGYTPTILPGYPDYSYTAGIDQSVLSNWWLFGSFTHLKYKAGPEDKANLFSVGTGLTLFKYLFGSVIYTYYKPTVTDTLHFFSFSIGVSF